MNVFIPEHLRKITIVNQLCQLIGAYGVSEQYIENPESSFDDYQYMLKTDPVKHYVSMCILESSFETDYENQSYEDVINYVTAKFYSVKGTFKVFEYMKKYLGLKFEGYIIYTPRYLEFSLKDLTVTDEGLYYTALKNFLNSLLYFITLKVNVGTITQEITSKISSNLGEEAFSYMKHLVEFGNSIYTESLIWYDNTERSVSKITYTYPIDLFRIGKLNITTKDINLDIKPSVRLRRATDLIWDDDYTGKKLISYYKSIPKRKKLTRISSIKVDPIPDINLDIQPKIGIRRSTGISFSNDCGETLPLGDRVLNRISSIAIDPIPDIELDIDENLKLKRSKYLEWLDKDGKVKTSIGYEYSESDLKSCDRYLYSVTYLKWVVPGDTSGTPVTSLDLFDTKSYEYNGKGPVEDDYAVLASKPTISNIKFDEINLNTEYSNFWELDKDFLGAGWEGSTTTVEHIIDIKFYSNNILFTKMQYQVVKDGASDRAGYLYFKDSDDNQYDIIVRKAGEEKPTKIEDFDNYRELYFIEQVDDDLFNSFLKNYTSELVG